MNIFNVILLAFICFKFATESFDFTWERLNAHQVKKTLRIDIVSVVLSLCCAFSLGHLISTMMTK